MKNRVLSSIALILNIAILALVILCIVSLHTSLFGDNPYGASVYIYFTVISNILVGFTALLEIPFLIRSISKRRFLLPRCLHVLKLVAVTLISVTMITALSYLSIILSFSKMIEGVNLFLHLIIPALALLSFVFIEAQSRIKFRATIFIFIPMVTYIAFYFIATLLVDIGIKDWYFFAYDYVNGVRSENVNILKSILSIVIFLFAPYVLSVVIWFLNQLMYKAIFVRVMPIDPHDPLNEKSSGKSVVIDEVKVEKKESTPNADDADVELIEAKEESEKKPKRFPFLRKSSSVEVIEEKKIRRLRKVTPQTNEYGKYEGKTRVYHIAQSKTIDGQWQVKLAGGERAIKIFKTQKEAIEYAKGLVRTQGGSIRIHSMKGKLRK